MMQTITDHYEGKKTKDYQDQPDIKAESTVIKEDGSLDFYTRRHKAILNETNISR